MTKLKECPFCGGEAVVKKTTKEFQIIGCKKLSMLCPNPSMVIHRKGEGYDYSPWNNRQSIPISKLEKMVDKWNKKWPFAGGISDDVKQLINEAKNDL